jgi:hypothetical protein
MYLYVFCEPVCLCTFEALNMQAHDGVHPVYK